MAKKSSQARLTIPKDIWDIAKFDDFDRKDFGFFILPDSRVIIANRSIGKLLDYQFLGSCTFDQKHRFFVPKNVDEYLGAGNIYYFTTSLKGSIVYFYKTSSESLVKLQNYQLNILINNFN